MFIRGRGIVGTMARTAVVAGTATAVSRRVNRRMDRSAEADLHAAQEQSYQQAAAQQPAPPQDDLTSQLQKLEQMKNAGSLSVEEYEMAKRKLLGA